MSLNLSNALQSYIYGQANKQSASMGLPLQLSGSASSSASAGPSKSGDISGGTAFNIGGINLGTQYPTAANAGGGAGGNPASLLGVAGSPMTLVLLAVAAVALIVILRK